MVREHRPTRWPGRRWGRTGRSEFRAAAAATQSAMWAAAPATCPPVRRRRQRRHRSGWLHHSPDDILHHSPDDIRHWYHSPSPHHALSAAPPGQTWPRANTSLERPGRRRGARREVPKSCARHGARPALATLATLASSWAARSAAAHARPSLSRRESHRGRPRDCPGD